MLRQTLGKGMRGGKTDTLWGRWVEARTRQHLLTPPCISHAHLFAQRLWRPLRPSLVLHFSPEGGCPRRPRQRRGLGTDGEAPSVREVRGCGGASSWEPRVLRDGGGGLPALPGCPTGSRQPARASLHGDSAAGGARVSHDGAAVAAQRALEAQGRVHVLAAGAADTLEQLAEEQQDVPVVLGGALHVATLPGLAH